MINGDKCGENIYHTMSQLMRDPLVLVPLSLLHSCMKTNNSYISPPESNEMSNVPYRINSKSGIQHIISSSNTLDRPEKGPNCFKSSKNIRTSVDAKPTLKGGKVKQMPPGMPQKLVYDCKICGDKASNHIHYGGRSCNSCRAFFRRTVETTSRYIHTDRLNLHVCILNLLDLTIAISSFINDTVISGMLVFSTLVYVERVASKKEKQFVQSANQQELIASIVDSKDVKHLQECQKNTSLARKNLE